MSRIELNQEEVQRKLWAEIRENRFGMLGLADDARQLQPMVAFAEPHERAIWFFVRRDSDLARAAADGGEGVFVVQSRDRDLQACISGELTVLHDQGRIDRYWSAGVAAWFPDGREDPQLTLLRLNASRGEVWLSRAGPVRMAWEIAKANLTHSEPDVGERRSLDLGGGGLGR
ncbi:MAG: pyridoxamine 5'-phosphate oxidase family protein [Caulobacteraceae bacterium]|nr:pyridoxamine 5'-phosphate oxidase family protein [Caulobacteraceae bacterium]